MCQSTTSIGEVATGIKQLQQFVNLIEHSTREWKQELEEKGISTWSAQLMEATEKAAELQQTLEIIQEQMKSNLKTKPEITIHLFK
ncbi:hypothetical protein [Ammoniphilus sp. CFH 90114]|uniref:hypothetical protein n=1 Tax=Ammoniphilus sp. CFH 90114 TaxID=2493665 RepID=UPI00100EB14D|nr:hypothetical protein [Ammoniphilus sp. CFH 90114]RXT07951.1 hypothetical protein EIZ39_11080 [Ammoniphilus sp. CFH 90114]